MKWALSQENRSLGGLDYVHDTAQVIYVQDNLDHSIYAGDLNCILTDKIWKTKELIFAI